MPSRFPPASGPDRSPLRVAIRCAPVRESAGNWRNKPHRRHRYPRNRHVQAEKSSASFVPERSVGIGLGEAEMAPDGRSGDTAARRLDGVVGRHDHQHDRAEDCVPVVDHEPTGGVDPITRRQFWDMIYEASHNGITVFVTTHYMDEAEYCDRVSIMVDGVIKALDSPAGLKKQFNANSMDEVFIMLARDAKRGE